MWVPRGLKRASAFRSKKRKGKYPMQNQEKLSSVTSIDLPINAYCPVQRVSTRANIVYGQYRQYEEGGDTEYL